MVRHGRICAKQSKKERERGKTSFSLPLISLPEDVVCGETILTWIGRKRLKIENYRSILVYTEERIRIQARKYKVQVTGKRLCIRYYDKDEMEISGIIENVNLE